MSPVLPGGGQILLGPEGGGKASGDLEAGRGHRVQCGSGSSAHPNSSPFTQNTLPNASGLTTVFLSIRPLSLLRVGRASAMDHLGYFKKHLVH